MCSFFQRVGLVTSVAAGAVLALGSPASAQSTYPSIANPGADEGLASWQGTGVTSTPYGASADVPSRPDNPALGAALFRAGASDAAIEQKIDLASLTTSIDAGQETLAAFAATGGTGSNDATMSVELHFKDATDSELGMTSFGGPNAAQRLAVTSLLSCYANAPIPRGSRTLVVRLVAKNGTGGLADNLQIAHGPTIPTAEPGVRFDDIGCFRPAPPTNVGSPLPQPQPAPQPAPAPRAKLNLKPTTGMRLGALRFTAGSNRATTVRVNARLGGVTIKRTLTFATAGSRTFTLRTTAAQNKRLRRALAKGTLAVRATITSSDTTATATARLRR